MPHTVVYHLEKMPFKTKSVLYFCVLHTVMKVHKVCR
jgi:hypothetical protein